MEDQEKLWAEKIRLFSRRNQNATEERDGSEARSATDSCSRFINPKFFFHKSISAPRIPSRSKPIFLKVERKMLPPYNLKKEDSVRSFYDQVRMHQGVKKVNPQYSPELKQTPIITSREMDRISHGSRASIGGIIIGRIGKNMQNKPLQTNSRRASYFKYNTMNFQVTAKQTEMSKASADHESEINRSEGPRIIFPTGRKKPILKKGSSIRTTGPMNEPDPKEPSSAISYKSDRKVSFSKFTQYSVHKQSNYNEKQ